MVTIKDIAKEIGLSRSTVAGVLSGKAKQLRISDRSVEKVQKAAQELGYQRNEVARSIAIGKTHIIGFLVPQVSSEHCTRTLEGVMQKAAEHEYFVKIIKVDVTSTPEEIAAICSGQRFDGVVCYNLSSADFVEKLHLLLTRKKIPVAIAGGCYSINKAIHITPNNKQGGKLAFEHLFELGHRSFFVPFEYCRERWASDRFCGFQEAAKDADLKLKKEFVPRSNASFNFTVENLKSIFHGKERPTAIFCLSDYTALQMLTGLSYIGFRVPDDISLVGYGNLSFTTECFPEITSIEEQLVFIGKRAVEALMKEINDSTYTSFYEEKVELFDVKLISRNSTKSI